MGGGSLQKWKWGYEWNKLSAELAHRVQCRTRIIQEYNILIRFLQVHLKQSDIFAEMQALLSKVNVR